MTKTDKAPITLLRILGVLALFAVVAVFMPMSWMVATHRWLGLGEMPTGPVVEYLARSLSAFYAIMGALCLVLATVIIGAKVLTDRTEDYVMDESEMYMPAL